MRMIFWAAPLLALAACADVETDGDTALDPTPDTEETADLPEDYEPATLPEEAAPPGELDQPVDGAAAETPGEAPTAQ